MSLHVLEILKESFLTVASFSGALLISALSVIAVRWMANEIKPRRVNYRNQNVRSYMRYEQKADRRRRR